MAARGETGREIAGSLRVPANPALRRAIAALSLTQLVGWGTTYYLPAILADAMAAGVGLPRALVFGGVTVMLLVAAIVAPAVGRRLARDGARGGMVAGSVLLALGLVTLSLAHGPVLFVLAWTIIGLAVPLALTQAATTAMVQIADEDQARRAITLLSLFSGFASTASWPMLAWLDGTIGWRASLVVYAGFHLCVAAPLHAFALPAAPPLATPRTTRTGPGAVSRPVPGAFGLAAAAFGLAGLVSWGLPLHVVSILREFGHAPSAAVAIGVVLGPAQVIARIIDLVGARRIGILEMGVAATALMPLAILALMQGTAVSAAVAFALGYGLSAGTMTIVRAMAPLRLFGREAFAVMTGRLAVPQNIAFAAAPLVFAGLFQGVGARGLLATALVAAAGAFATMLVLARRARRAASP